MPIQSVYSDPYLNGGMLGATLSFDDNNRYILSQDNPTYVTGSTPTGGATTSTLTIALPSGIQEGDLVIVTICIASTTSRSFRISDSSGSVTGYTEVASLYANDTYDTNLQVGYKFAGATPDTNFYIVGGSGSANDGCSIAIHVWRNVDPTTPMDVTPVTLTQTNTALVNPPAITPVTTGAEIIIAGGAAHNGGFDTFTASYLSNFETTGFNDTNDSSIGLGSVSWTGGTYDGAAWTFSQASSTSFSCASCVMALRPKITYGNKKNSGVWNLQAALESLIIYPAFAGYSLVTSSSSASSRTVSVPSEASVGDLLVAVFYETDGRSLTSSPAGWTAGPFFSNSNTSVWLFYKTMQSGDVSATATISSGALFGAIMVAFRDCTYDTGQAVYDSDGVVNFSGITVANPNSILCLLTTGGASFTALSSPWVTIVNQNSAMPYAYSAYQESVSAGSTGAIAVTGGSGTKGGGVLFAMSYTGGA